LVYIIFYLYNYFFFSNKKTNGETAKKATKKRVELKVNGPILSIPVSWAMNVVPQIMVQIIKQTNDIVFFIELKLYR